MSGGPDQLRHLARAGGGNAPALASVPGTQLGDPAAVEVSRKILDGADVRE